MRNKLAFMRGIWPEAAEPLEPELYTWEDGSSMYWQFGDRKLIFAYAPREYTVKQSNEVRRGNHRSRRWKTLATTRDDDYAFPLLLGIVSAPPKPGFVVVKNKIVDDEPLKDFVP